MLEHFQAIRLSVRELSHDEAHALHDKIRKSRKITKRAPASIKRSVTATQRRMAKAAKLLEGMEINDIGTLEQRILESMNNANEG